MPPGCTIKTTLLPCRCVCVKAPAVRRPGSSPHTHRHGPNTAPDSPAFRPLHSASRIASPTPLIVSLRSSGSEPAETGEISRPPSLEVVVSTASFRFAGATRIRPTSLRRPIPVRHLAVRLRAGRRCIPPLPLPHSPWRFALPSRSLIRQGLRYRDPPNFSGGFQVFLSLPVASFCRPHAACFTGASRGAL